MKKITLITISILINLGIYAQGCITCNGNSISNDGSAIGTNNIASGSNSMAFGTNNQALGTNSFSLGYHSIANGSGSISMGIYNESVSSYSLTLGNYLKAQGSNAMVIGRGVSSTNVLLNSTARSLMVGFYSDIPTLFVGTSNGPGTIGKVGIGTTSPATLLDINGTLNVEDAATLRDDLIVSGSLNLSGVASLASNLNVGGELDVSGNATYDNDVDIAGKLTTQHLQITSGAGADKVLVSDAAGNASWETVENVVPASIWTQDNNNVYVSGVNVGIGTSNPTAQLTLADIYNAGGKNLQVGNDIYLSDIDQANTLGIYGVQNDDVGSIKLGGNGPRLYGKNGKLGIGTTNPTETLTVNGNLLCEQIEVIENVPASDFVFEEDYPLMSLRDLEAFVKENHHLPEIPSAEEFKSNGYNMNDMDDLLLRKVEELTLYIIELEKEVKSLKKRLEN